MIHSRNNSDIWIFYVLAIYVHTVQIYKIYLCQTQSCAWPMMEVVNSYGPRIKKIWASLNAFVCLLIQPDLYSRFFKSYSSRID